MTRTDTTSGQTDFVISQLKSLLGRILASLREIAHHVTDPVGRAALLDEGVRNATVAGYLVKVLGLLSQHLDGGRGEYALGQCEKVGKRRRGFAYVRGKKRLDGPQDGIKKTIVPWDNAFAHAGCDGRGEGGRYEVNGEFVDAPFFSVVHKVAVGGIFW